MLPVNCGSHADYQNFVVETLRKYYPDPNVLTRSTWDIIERFWHLDLSDTNVLLADKYSKFGPAPRIPSCMQRSYLLSIDFKVSSITEWAAQLKMNPLFAILSGFRVDDTPGVGTFYDFMKRLWDSDDPHMSPHIHPLKTKVKKGLIHKDNLALAGDGTPVVTSHRERKKRICKCKENGIFDCSCDRYFSQPDCDIGWDSSRDCFYHGYDLYMLVDSQSDLPVFSHYSCASTHDPHGFLQAFFRMRSFLPDYKVSKVLLDSAHDAMPYYQYFKRQNITPFIDLNSKAGKPPVYKNDFTIDKDGVPVCPAGHRMRRDGIEAAKGRMKFKCPKISHAGGCISCTCDNPCSNAKYGRTVHLVLNDNPRLFNNPPRSSKEWKQEYNARTSVERSNKREKLDFRLEDGRHRSTKMWYCRLYHILMLQHLDAWDLPSESPLRKLILDVA